MDEIKFETEYVVRELVELDVEMANERRELMELLYLRDEEGIFRGRKRLRYLEAFNFYFEICCVQDGSVNLFSVLGMFRSWSDNFYGVIIFF